MSDKNASHSEMTREASEEELIEIRRLLEQRKSGAQTTGHAENPSTPPTRAATARELEPGVTRAASAAEVADTWNRAGDPFSSGGSAVPTPEQPLQCPSRREHGARRHV